MAGIRQVPSIIQPALSSVWAAESGGYLGSRAASTKASPLPQLGLILTAIWVMRGTRQGAYTRHNMRNSKLEPGIRPSSAGEGLLILPRT